MQKHRTFVRRFLCCIFHQHILVRDGRLELPTSCSQSKRATNCANPGFLVIEFCARCGQTCGQAVFLTISACGGSACIAGVSRDCGHGIFRLEGGATRSQSKRATNCATPGHIVPAAGPERGPGQFPGSSYCTKSGPDVKGFLADGTPSRLPVPRRRRTRRCTTPGDSSTDSPPGRRPWCRTAPLLRRR